MSDKVKFYSMTKPLPFRKIRLMLRSWKEGITDIILNILYKLNKIEKYSISDVMRNEEDLNIPPKHFSSGCISADLVFNTIHEEQVHEEYYHKKGNRLKKLKVFYDSHYHRVIISAHMTNIYIVMPDGSLISVQNGLPVFKFHVNLPEEVRPFNPDEPLKNPDIDTYEIDMRPLQGLRFQKAISVSEDYKEDFKEIDWSLITDEMKKSFVDYFKGVKLYDLMRKRC